MIAAVLSSAFGTKRTSRFVLNHVCFWGKADIAARRSGPRTTSPSCRRCCAKRNTSHFRYPLSGVKRTSNGRAPMSAYDPKRTSDGRALMSAFDPKRTFPLPPSVTHWRGHPEAMVAPARPQATERWISGDDLRPRAVSRTAARSGRLNSITTPPRSSACAASRVRRG